MRRSYSRWVFYGSLVCTHSLPPPQQCCEVLLLKKIIHLIWLSGNNSFQPPPKSHTCTIFSCCWLRKLRRVHRELCTSCMHTATLLLCSKTTSWLCQAVGDTSGLFCISIDDELRWDTHIFEQEWNQPHWIVTAIIKHNDKVTFHWLFLAYTWWNIFYYLDYKTQTSALWDCQGFSSKTLSNILIAFFVKGPINQTHEIIEC